MLSEYLSKFGALVSERVCACVCLLHSRIGKAPLIGLLHKSMLMETELGN